MSFAKKYTLVDQIHYTGLFGNLKENVLVRETVTILAYFSFYISYSFFFQEPEYLHWLTQVLIPFALLHYIQRKNLISPSVRLSLAFFGLRKNNLHTGILFSAIIGLLLSIFPVLARGEINSLSQIFSSPSVIIILPVTFILLFVTVGFTEEFLFRGVLQTRLVRLVNSKWLGIGITSLLYAIYRVTHYSLTTAATGIPIWDPYLFVVFIEGVVFGLLLGFIYVKNDENLLSAVILHSTIQIFSTMVVLKDLWF